MGDPSSVNGIPVDLTILNAALVSRLEDSAADMAVLDSLKNNRVPDSCKVVHFQQFDPVHKRTKVSVKSMDGKEFKVTKCAPQVILELSTKADQVQHSPTAGAKLKVMTNHFLLELSEGLFVDTVNNL